MPLSKFIVCLCDNDLSAMIISGAHELDVIQRHFMNIYVEFIELTEDPDVQQITRLTRDRYILLQKKLKVENMVSYLAIQWDEDFVKRLRAMNYRYKFDPLRPAEYSRDLNLILTRCERFKTEADILQLEIDSINSKNQGGTVDRIYFNKRLVTLGKWYGSIVKPDSVTVAGYAEMLKQYNDYCNQINMHNNARNR